VGAAVFVARVPCAVTPNWSANRAQEIDALYTHQPGCRPWSRTSRRQGLKRLDAAAQGSGPRGRSGVDCGRKCWGLIARNLVGAAAWGSAAHKPAATVEGAGRRCCIFRYPPAGRRSTAARSGGPRRPAGGGGGRAPGRERLPAPMRFLARCCRTRSVPASASNGGVLGGRSMTRAGWRLFFGFGPRGARTSGVERSAAVFSPSCSATSRRSRVARRKGCRSQLADRGARRPAWRVLAQRATATVGPGVR